MLPCNTIVQQKSDGIEVSAVDPIASMQAVNNPGLESIAQAVREKLKRAIERIGNN